MKQLMSILAAFLLTFSCFSQSNEYNVLSNVDSWEYLEYSNMIDSINLKQNDGSSWQSLKFYSDASVTDSKIRKDIVSSSNILEVIDRLGEIHLDILCKSSVKKLTPISKFYYTILSSGEEKVIIIMYPVGS